MSEPEKNGQLDLYEALARVRDLHYAIAEVYNTLVQTKASPVWKELTQLRKVVELSAELNRWR